MKAGYCSECGTYVSLNDDLSCRHGHPRSSIRDVRDFSRAPSPIPPATPNPSPHAGRQEPEYDLTALIGMALLYVASIVVMCAGCFVTFYIADTLDTILQWVYTLFALLFVPGWIVWKVGGVVHRWWRDRR